MLITGLCLAPIVFFAWWCILRIVHNAKTIRPLPPYRISRDAIIPPPPKMPREARESWEAGVERDEPTYVQSVLD